MSEMDVDSGAQPPPQQERSIVQRSTAEMTQSSAPNDGRRTRQTLGEVLEMSFEEKRDELVESYAVSFPELADQLRTATTPNEAWQILNSQETRAVTEEEMEEINNLSLASGDKADVQKEMNRLREEAFEKYSVIDKKTGQVRMADFNDPDHRQQLREKMSLFITKTHTPEQQDRMEAAAAYAMHMAEDREPPTLSKDEAELYEKTGKLPVDYERRRKARMKRHESMALVSRAEYNRIVALSDKEGCSSCMPHKMPFARLLQNQLPLSQGFFIEAMQMAATQTRNSLTMSNMYPTYVYESKLRLLMYGSGSPNVTTSFRYHETVHSVFMRLLGTNKKLNHGAFLDKEYEVCQNMQKDMRDRQLEYEQAVRSGNYGEDELAEELRQIKASRDDVAAFAQGIALAKKALTENGEVVSPFAPFMQREKNKWTELDVPRHSKEQIIQIVEYLHEMERIRQNRAMEELDRSFRESPVDEHADEWRRLRTEQMRFSFCNTHTTEEMEKHKERTKRLEKLRKMRAKRNIVDTEEFLIRFWQHNHISSVQTCMCYETGLLLMYEDAIPSAYRADLVLRTDMVKPTAIVFPSVSNDLQRQRDFYATIRRHYTERMRELFEEAGEEHLIKHSGVDLDLRSIEAYANTSVNSNELGAPTFAQLAEFYYIINKNYGSVEKVAFIPKFVDEAYAAIYNDDGTLVDDFEKTLSEQRLKKDVRGNKRRRVNAEEVN